MNGRWRGRGCLRSAFGLLALAVVAPPALLLRWWRSRRRGAEPRVEWKGERSADESLAVWDLHVDVPVSRRSGLSRQLTDLVARVAEAIRQPDDAYVMVYRAPTDPKSTCRALGPTVHQLGEWFSLHLGQESLGGRTILWAALDRATSLATVFDPQRYDPEAEGEPEALLATLSVRWAAATCWLAAGPATRCRLKLWAPGSAAPAVEEVLERFAGSLRQVTR